jgi:hypothetical protein
MCLDETEHICGRRGVPGAEQPQQESHMMAFIARTHAVDTIIASQHATPGVIGDVLRAEVHRRLITR